MRVTRISRDESGVTAVIVVLCLTVFMGMLMLVVDVGGLLLARRDMVNGADAAALGAAQSCAGLPGAPVDEADALASQNINDDPSLTRLDFSIIEGSCPGPSGKLRVEYQVSSDLTFAPALGLSDTSPVAADATAMWGSAGASDNVVPLMLRMDQLQGNCQVPNVPEGETCAFWYNNQPSELGDAQWGFLNLFQWDVTPGHNCSSPGTADRRDWINNGFGEILSLNYPDPTYVCADSGHSNATWPDIRDQIGKVLVFPVNDQFTQLPAPPPTTPDKYNIVGFASLKLVGLYNGNDPAAIGTSAQTAVCPGSPISHEFTKEQPTRDISSEIASCEVVNGGLTVIEPPALPGTEGVDWNYNASTNIVTWLSFGGANKKKVDIGLNYVQPGTSGACEPPERPSDPNAKCLITEWVGFQFGGSNPGGAIDFGYSAVRLND
jgi:Putative Flp pilus-assembly TadE/G-like